MREDRANPLTDPERRAEPAPGDVPGNRGSLDRFVPAVYQHLREIAHRELRREREAHTLDTGALVHEAYLKLARDTGVEWANRDHFLAIAARSMRTILIDHARARGAAKRGGEALVITLRDSEVPVETTSFEALLELDIALDRLAAIDESACRTVECRYFAGLTLPEVAAVLGLSCATVERRWAFAKAWLRRELSVSD